MNKQELARRIVRDMGYEYQTVRNIIDGIAFEGWLHGPNQVPGRTITESAEGDLYDAAQASGSEFRAVLSEQGITVVPDPEPTNAEQIIELMGMAPASMNRRELAKWLDSRGVKAPGGDDE